MSKNSTPTRKYKLMFLYLAINIFLVWRQLDKPVGRGPQWAVEPRKRKIRQLEKAMASPLRVKPLETFSAGRNGYLNGAEAISCV